MKQDVQGFLALLTEAIKRYRIFGALVGTYMRPDAIAIRKWRSCMHRNVYSFVYCTLQSLKKRAEVQNKTNCRQTIVQPFFRSLLSYKWEELHEKLRHIRWKQRIGRRFCEMKIITVNQTSAITSIQKLLPNLKRGENAKIILIGSTAGLDNAGNSQVSYVSSKFGIRGVGSAIREHVRKYGIGVTVINPGEIAETPFEQGSEKAISEFQGKRIPAHDIVHLAKCVISLSKVACVKEINVPAMEDMNA